MVHHHSPRAPSRVHITVHAPPPPPPPVAAPPQEIHLIVHAPPAAKPAPPAPPTQNTVNIGAEDLPPGTVEGAEQHGRHVVIHIDPKTDITSRQKVINVEMKARNHPDPQKPKLANQKEQYNGLKDNGSDTIVTPLANKNHHCQTTPTANGNLIVTCTSVIS